MPRTIELLGRTDELDELTGWLDDACLGRSRAVVIVGEAGIGKTSLAEAVAGAASDRGFRVAWGRCPALDAPPYFPWSQLLATLVGTDELLAPGRFGSLPELCAAVAELLGQLAAQDPLLLVVEDAHWVDGGSTAVLEFLSQALAGQRVMLLVTTREEGETLAASPGVRRVLLGGLAPDATARLVGCILGEAPRTYVAEVQRRTAGNPYFITELARLQASRGGGPGVVPDRVRKVLEQRLARLPQASVELLELASVLDAVASDLLARISGATQDQVDQRLGPARAAGIVVGDAFAHDLMRETVYDGLGRLARARLHRLAAEHLQAAGPAVLAHHWSLSEGDDARRRAAELSFVAAEQATAGSAHEEAVRHYRAALARGRRGLEVRRGLGSALVHSGRIAEGREVLRLVCREALERGEAEELALAALALGGGIGGFEVDVFDTEQPAWLDRALALLPPGDSALRAALLARLSLARATVGTPEERATQAAEAVAMAERVGAREVEAGALGALCDAHSGPDYAIERLAAASRIVALAVGNGLLELLGRRLRIRALLELGDRTGVDVEIAAYARTAERLRSATYSWPVSLWRGMQAVRDGDLEAGAMYAEELARLSREAGSENAWLMGWALEWSLARERQDQAAIRRLLQVILTLPEHGSDCTFALLFAEAGELERAREHLRRLRGKGLDAIPRNSEYLERLWSAGWAALLAGDAEMGELVREALLPFVDLWAVDGYGAAVFGRVGDLVDRLGGDVEPAPSVSSVSSGPVAAVFTVAAGLRKVEFRGRAATLPDAKGMRDLAVLLARPGTEVHVLDLVEAAGGAPRAQASGGLGPALDAEARRAYARRLEEIEEELDRAAADHDDGPVSALAEEQEFLLAELGAALGLGGRPRTAGDPVERARKAVTMRIGTAFRAIEAVHPELGRHLRNSIATGRFCVYRPEEPVEWRT